MIELIINNTNAILPDDFPFSLIEANTELTKNGEYTLDITLSLLEQINAKIFGHITRRNITTLMKEAEAIFIINGKFLHGKIIDIENTDVDVTFQFVADNSELNYDSTDKKIWDYDWGSEVYSYQDAFTSVHQPSYLNNYVCVPVKFSDMITNEPVHTCVSTTLISSIRNITLNPYLIYYINKLPEVFGYTMGENVLADDDLLKIMYMPNRVRSFNYADFLPDMTVSAFISAIEEFFNVSFNFSSRNKTLKIVSNKTNLTTKKRVAATITDTYKRSINDTADIFNYKKLTYNISTEGVNKYLCIPDEIKLLCEYVNVNTYSALTALVTSGDKNLYKIYRVLETGKQYIYGDATDTNYYREIIAGKDGYLYRVNIFEDHESENITGEKHELNIVPATIIPYEFSAEGYLGVYPNGERKTYKFSTQICTVSAATYRNIEQGIIDALDSDLNVIPRANKIEIALYKGYTKILGMYETYYEPTDYPMSFTHEYPVFWLPSGTWNSNQIAAFILNLQTYFMVLCNKAIDIKTILGLYRPLNLIDSTVRYQFNVIDSNITCDDILVYDGAEYIPVYFEKQMNKTGDKNNFTGYFYRLK